MLEWAGGAEKYNIKTKTDLMDPMMGVCLVLSRATKAGNEWLMWIRMSTQLEWLETKPTGRGGGEDCGGGTVGFTLIHLTRTNPRQNRHALQWILPNVATQSARTEAGKTMESLIKKK